MILIFNPDHTANDQTKVNGYNIPLHGSEGTGHFAFAIDHTEIEDWNEHLINALVNIESQVNWPNVANLLYFRDPAGNSLELVSPTLCNCALEVFSQFVADRIKLYAQWNTF